MFPMQDAEQWAPVYTSQTGAARRTVIYAPVTSYVSKAEGARDRHLMNGDGGAPAAALCA